MNDFYHDGHTALQEEMGTTRIAERLARTRLHGALDEADQAMIVRACMFFIATGSADGMLDCSVKCGPPGFVRVEDAWNLLIPDYDGNGMFRTLGNIRAHPTVALLFVDWEAKRKLRISGHAQVVTEPASIRDLPGAQAAVRVRVQGAFPNCPRYLPDLCLVAHSEFTEALGRHALEPTWKKKVDLKDFVHVRRAF